MGARDIISGTTKELRGFEIVVASSNNGAVENVTLEIPGEKAVDPDWLDKVDALGELTDHFCVVPEWERDGIQRFLHVFRYRAEIPPADIGRHVDLARNQPVHLHAAGDAREADRERLAQIYRFGHVLQHVERDGRVSIEADVPRRLWSRLRQEGEEGR